MTWIELTRPLLALSVLGALLLGSPTVGAADRPLPLQAVARIPLPGAERALRLHEHRPDIAPALYRAHGRDELLVFDLQAPARDQDDPAPGVHGVIAVPALRRVYASATNEHRWSRSTPAPARSSPAHPPADYPDGLAYDPVERHVFVSDESGGVETVLDAAGHRIATIDLGGEAGNVQYDAGTGRRARRRADPRRHRDHRPANEPHRPARRAARVQPRPRPTDRLAASSRLRRMRRKRHAYSHSTCERCKIIDRHLRRREPRRARLRQLVASTLRLGRERHRRRIPPKTPHGLTKLGQAFLATEAHTVAVDPTPTSCTSRSRVARPTGPSC